MDWPTEALMETLVLTLTDAVIGEPRIKMAACGKRQLDQRIASFGDRFGGEPLQVA